ncbi:MAG: (2Fe-2S) ferredoxin domain-containing protein [Alphaproteobacteria bacterium]|nr:(2Fe-2S) ferredoxin domain-containing protein [Alphaproteobacteria bacterium]
MQETDQYFRAHVFCCSNQRPPGHARGCCADKNAEALRNHLKRRAKELGLDDVRINNAGCLDRCEFGPVLVVYPQGVWYRAETVADIEEILVQHLQNGQPVTRLALSRQCTAK